jgi:transposase
MELSLSPGPKRLVKKRLRKAPGQRFKPDISEQFDLVWGCPSASVPHEHLVRSVKELLAGLDFSSTETKYSSQGQHGFHPRHVLGALLYGSLLGIHHSTKLAASLKTDMALRFVAGGHVISEGRLRAFRRENLALYEGLHMQVLTLAGRLGLIDTGELAVDSVRLRAHASTKAVRTRKRAKARLKELAEVDVAQLTPEELAEHEAKALRHQDTVRLCDEQQRPNIVTTSPSAGLMKFPDGGAAPGHRGTVVAAGVSERLVIDVFVDGSGNDVGKLGPAIIRARQRLEAAGIPLEKPMQVAGDAGYFTAEDLAFAANNRTWVDILIDEARTAERRNEHGEPLFGLGDFEMAPEGMKCPANRLMKGPYADGARERWEGKDCGTCGLRLQCTRGKVRTLTIDPRFNSLRNAMRTRMGQDGARARYNKRIATVEPVFSSLESGMNYRRVSTRLETAIKAEVMLKVLAYNVSRVLTRKRLRRVRFQVSIEALQVISLAA